MSTGAIIGISVGALVLVLALGIGLVLFLNTDDTDIAEPDQTTGDTTGGDNDPTGDNGDVTGRIPGDGVFLVGDDMPSGTYQATVPTESLLCYWARLAGTDPDNIDEIHENGLAEPGDEVTVTILESDVAFESSGCGAWTLV